MGTLDGVRTRRAAGVGRGLEARVVTVALVSTITALLAAFSIYQWRNWSADRADLASDSITFAQEAARTAQAALGRDPAHAAAAVATLLYSSGDARAVVYVDASGRRLDVSRDGWRHPEAAFSGGTRAQARYSRDGLVVDAPLIVAGRRAGEAVVWVDDRELISGRLLNIAIALGLSLAATLASGLMAHRLARRALAPLRALDASMAAVTASRDFGGRLPIAREDEVGKLTERFNGLLAALETYDEDLRGALTQATTARDAAERASAMKAQFLGNMGHELRTPLNGVLGMSQALLRSDLTGAQRERVEVIQKSGSALLAVLNDILDLADIESGAMRLAVAPFDLRAVLDAACETAVTLAQSKGLSLDVEIEASAAGRWRGDATRLRQVVYNLVSNGLKFTAAGGVTVRAAATLEGLWLAVADTGVGIRPEALPHLFDKFTQGDAGATREVGGAGVGLAICRSLVRLMGGEISVESRPGAGSVFTVRLPLEQTDAGAPRSPQGPSDGPLRVLIAEDNETNQRVVCAVLGALGVQPTVVADGRAAVEAWGQAAWDLILMDIQMPVLDGVAAAREIRRLEAERGVAPTRIVALTASATPDQADIYAAAGMDGVVPKPIMIEQLQAALADARMALAA